MLLFRVSVSCLRSLVKKVIFHSTVKFTSTVDPQFPTMKPPRCPFVAEVCLSICWPSGHGTVVFSEQEVALSCVEIKRHLLSWHVLTWFWGLSSASSRNRRCGKTPPDNQVLFISSALSVNARWLRTEAGAPSQRPSLHRGGENEKDEVENKVQFRAAERAGETDLVDQRWNQRGITWLWLAGSKIDDGDWVMETELHFRRGCARLSQHVRRHWGLLCPPLPPPPRWRPLHPIKPVSKLESKFKDFTVGSADILDISCSKWWVWSLSHQFLQYSCNKLTRGSNAASCDVELRFPGWRAGSCIEVLHNPGKFTFQSLLSCYRLRLSLGAVGSCWRQLSWFPKRWGRRSAVGPRGLPDDRLASDARSCVDTELFSQSFHCIS